MITRRLTRRRFLQRPAGTVFAAIVTSSLVSSLGLAGCGPARAPGATPTVAMPTPTPSPVPYPSSIRFGINLPFTGVNSADALTIRDGALLKIDQINAAGGIAGRIKIEHVIKDEGTVAAGGQDPAQAVTNLKQFLEDPSLLAIVGPYSLNGEAMLTAMTQMAAARPDLPPVVLVTPTNTKPMLTDPAYGQTSRYRPRDKPYFFRTVATDASQGTVMAQFAAAQLGLKSVAIISDRPDVGQGDPEAAFAAAARARAISIVPTPDGNLYHLLDPKKIDYRDVLQSLVGQADGIYFGGDVGPGQKLADGIYNGGNAIQKFAKLATDNFYDAGFVRRLGALGSGWYVTAAAPATIDKPNADTPEVQAWVAAYQQAFNHLPNNYAVTAYDAVAVIADAIDRVLRAVRPLTRDNVQSSLLQTKNLQTLQGRISFDENGDLVGQVVSVFQIQDGAYQYVANARPT